MATDSILKVIVTKGVEITAVAHGGRTIRSHHRTALEAHDPVCIVPGCGMRRGPGGVGADPSGDSDGTKPESIAMYRTGIPDLDIRIQHIVAEDDLVVTRVESWHDVDDRAAADRRDPGLSGRPVRRGAARWSERVPCRQLDRSVVTGAAERAEKAS